MIRKLILIFIGMLLLCGCASATDYYVSPSGNDANNGTLNYPLATLQYACGQLTAGDTLYVIDGLYPNQKATVSGLTGNENTYTNIVAYNGTPIFTGTYTSTQTEVFLIIDNCDYFNVSGLMYENYYKGVSVHECTNVNVVGMHSNHTYGVSIEALDSSYVSIRDNHIHNVTGGGDSLGVWVQSVLDGTHHIDIINNTITDNPLHNGIDLCNGAYNSSYYIHDVNILNNHVYNMVDAAIWEHGSTPWSMTNFNISGNRFHDCETFLVAYLKDSVIRDNIIYNTTNYGISSTTNTGINGNVTFSNNTVYNTTSFDVFIQYATNYSINDRYSVFDNNNISSIRFEKEGYSYIHNPAKSFNLRLPANYTPGTFGNVSLHFDNGTVVKSLRTGSWGPNNLPYYVTDGSWVMYNTTPANVGPSNYGTYTITKYNYSAKPATGTATVTPNSPVGNELANFTAESTNGNPVTFNAWGLTSGAQYRIKEDGVEKSTQLANESGMISWVNSAWSEHVYTVEDTGLRLPVCAFTANATDGTAPKTIQFTDTSTQNPETWSWDFNGDDVEDSTEQNPVWTYDTDGSYDVSLTVTNAIGSDTETKTDYIKLTNPYVAPIILTTVAAALLFMRARRRW